MVPTESEILAERIKDLPGADLVREGLRDLYAREETLAALLVLIGAPKLRQLGFDVPSFPSSAVLPEHRLYERLALEHGDGAHSQYNALIRRLVSFERAAACVGL